MDDLQSVSPEELECFVSAEVKENVKQSVKAACKALMEEYVEQQQNGSTA